MRAIHFYLSFSIQPNTTTHKPKREKKKNDRKSDEPSNEQKIGIYSFERRKKNAFSKLESYCGTDCLPEEIYVCICCASGQRQRPNGVHILLFLYILFHYYLSGRRRRRHRRHYNVQTNVTLNLMAEQNENEKKNRTVGFSTPRNGVAHLVSTEVAFASLLNTIRVFDT